MDVQQMMKVNSLSRELRRHQMGVSAEQAVRQAEEAYGNVFDRSGSYANAMPVIHSPTLPQSTPVGPQVLEQPKAALASDPFGEQDQLLLNRKIEILVKKSNSQLESQVDALREMVVALNRELDNMKRAFQQKLEEPKPFVLASPAAAVQAPPAAPVAAPTPAPAAAAPYHPKQGNVTSADVAIEKMFYFGNRK